MNRQHGIELSGEFSPFLRACIGVGILLIAAAPFVLSLGKLLHWVRWW